MSSVNSSGRLRVGRIPGYPNYRVLSSGSVWSRQRGRWRRISCFFDRYGYLQLNLSSNGHNRRHFLHSVVLMAFVGLRPSGKQCRHLDGNPLNNRLENLCWGTSKENLEDKRRHGSRLSHNHKLNPGDVLEIRRRASEGKWGIRTVLAKEYGVSNANISRIVKGQRWSHV